MPLSQDDRIVISKKVIDIPVENESALMIKGQLDVEKQKAVIRDNANKSIMDDITPLIDGYQLEKTAMDGITYTELLEQDMIDSANKILNNYFFPNNNQVPLPSVPDGIWKFFPPFGGSLARGLTYTEGTGSVTSEQDYLTGLVSYFATLDGYPVPERSTGKQSLVDNVYTPYTPIINFDLAFAGVIAVWRTFIISRQAGIITNDPDPVRQAQNDIAIQNIDDTVAIIDAWLALPTFDTTTMLPATMALYNAMIATDFVPSKYRSTEFNILKAGINARQSFVNTRKTQVATNLGTVGQNLSTGEINNSGSGLYDRRFKVIDLRLNLLTGTLNVVVSLELGKNVQDQLIASNENALTVYGLVMQVSRFRAPALNTNIIHVMDGSLFQVSDMIYVVANNQVEISGNITAIDGNTITMDVVIPAKYTTENSARMYKTL